MPDRRFHDRRWSRRPGWDYAAPAAYFVTIRARGRGRPFGDIVDGLFDPSPAGTIVGQSWRWLASRPDVELDEWCLMPDHLHGIVRLKASTSASPKPLGQLIGAFKTVSTKHINVLRQTPGAIVWQRGYWDHVIRDDVDLDRIRKYIHNNVSVGAARERP